MKNQVRIDIAGGDDAKLSHVSEANEHLIELAKRGDRDALNRILAAARPRMLAVAMRVVHNADDAEDVVQESLLKVCRSLTRFEGRSAFGTWLHRIVVNTSLDRLRRPEARRDSSLDAQEGHSASQAAGESVRRAETVRAIDEQTPERLYAQAEAGAALQTAMAQLSPVHREVLSLRELDGESYQDIASIARCPVGTVMSRLHHARRRLAVELAPAYAA
jgi:RNA polymerase sigma-70 factor (ECF subfamily)